MVSAGGKKDIPFQLSLLLPTGHPHPGLESPEDREKGPGSEAICCNGSSSSGCQHHLQLGPKLLMLKVLPVEGFLWIDKREAHTQFFAAFSPCLTSNSCSSATQVPEPHMQNMTTLENRVVFKNAKVRPPCCRITEK